MEKKLSDYTAKDLKKVLQKPVRKSSPKLMVKFQKKNLGIKMMLDKIDSEISFRNRIVGN